MREADERGQIYRQPFARAWKTASREHGPRPGDEDQWAKPFRRGLSGESCGTLPCDMPRQRGRSGGTFANHSRGAELLPWAPAMLMWLRAWNRSEALRTVHRLARQAGVDGRISPNSCGTLFHDRLGQRRGPPGFAGQSRGKRIRGPRGVTTAHGTSWHCIQGQTGLPCKGPSCARRYPMTSSSLSFPSATPARNCA